jgi:hypothetical protein
LGECLLWACFYGRSGKNFRAVLITHDKKWVGLHFGLFFSQSHLATLSPAMHCALHRCHPPPTLSLFFALASDPFNENIFFYWYRLTRLGEFSPIWWMFT